ncbi:hypothetical protein NXW61_03640 [Bacteroides xylanisolvens]|nr:hypothetical protein [Bacteroides xylanisolvens]
MRIRYRILALAAAALLSGCAKESAVMNLPGSGESDRTDKDQSPYRQRGGGSDHRESAFHALSE